MAEAEFDIIKTDEVNKLEKMKNKDYRIDVGKDDDKESIRTPEIKEKMQKSFMERKDQIQKLELLEGSEASNTDEEDEGTVEEDKLSNRSNSILLSEEKKMLSSSRSQSEAEDLCSVDIVKDSKEE